MLTIDGTKDTAEVVEVIGKVGVIMRIQSIPRDMIVPFTFAELMSRKAKILQEEV